MSHLVKFSFKIYGKTIPVLVKNMIYTEGFIASFDSKLWEKLRVFTLHSRVEAQPKMGLFCSRLCLNSGVDEAKMLIES